MTKLEVLSIIVGVLFLLVGFCAGKVVMQVIEATRKVFNS